MLRCGAWKLNAASPCFVCLVVIYCPGVIEDVSSSILIQLQLADRLFIETCKDRVKVVGPIENKCMDTFFINPAEVQVL